MHVCKLLEESDNLQSLVSVVRQYVLDDEKCYALRYLASPYISDDDLKVLADVKLSASAFDSDPEAADRIVKVVSANIDPWRFPWFHETGCRLMGNDVLLLSLRRHLLRQVDPRHSVGLMRKHVRNLKLLRLWKKWGFVE